MKYQSELILETCCNCGVNFGIEIKLKRNLLDDGSEFYCTNGHRQYYNKKQSLEAKLREKDKEIKDLKTRPDFDMNLRIGVSCEYRYANIFEDNDIKTIGDAMEFGEVELLGIHGIGRVAIDQINGYLYDFNMGLK